MELYAGAFNRENAVNRIYRLIKTTLYDNREVGGPSEPAISQFFNHLSQLRSYLRHGDVSMARGHKAIEAQDAGTVGKIFEGRLRITRDSSLCLPLYIIKRLIDPERRGVNYLPAAFHVHA